MSSKTAGATLAAILATPESTLVISKGK